MRQDSARRRVAPVCVCVCACTSAKQETKNYITASSMCYTHCYIHCYHDGRSIRPRHMYVAMAIVRKGMSRWKSSFDQTYTDVHVHTALYRERAGRGGGGGGGGGACSAVVCARNNSPGRNILQGQNMALLCRLVGITDQ